MSTKFFSRYSLLVTVFALIVIVLGAFVRLSDAGLGCPDWPGCYGLIDVPQTDQEIEVAEQAFPQRPVEESKAWKEMFHRYFAGTLGILIVILAVLSFRTRFESKNVPLLSVSLVGLVIFQALLGMWTVTLQVKPAIVTLHLLFGMATVSLLWLTFLNSSGGFSNAGNPSGLKGLTKLALVVVIGQIALGGWTSTNYAALACTAFPGCYAGDAWPDMDFSEAFVLWRGLGINYEFGVLEPDARAAIHMIHRLGAVFVLIVVGALGLQALKKAQAAQRKIAIILLILLGLQLTLGVLNVILSLPLANAVAHNGVAALLLLALIAYYHTEIRLLKQH
jgi:cytochrome c oxidase assembly protein subunit 15